MGSRHAIAPSVASTGRAGTPTFVPSLDGSSTACHTRYRIPETRPHTPNNTLAAPPSSRPRRSLHWQDGHASSVGTVVQAQRHLARGGEQRAVRQECGVRSRGVQAGAQDEAEEAGVRAAAHQRVGRRPHPPEVSNVREARRHDSPRNGEDEVQLDALAPHVLEPNGLPSEHLDLKEHEENREDEVDQYDASAHSEQDGEAQQLREENFPPVACLAA
mmetsp:Transcript_27624/g.41707  ORF Transcript_27624/g.41707 Transcript_27624/m.41707 type:complete len:217 (+) Transcript_27624:85-735(+)|eukprot:CAMPEP_0184391338 /NCGR_PEP_ID=MMETSP0007-20130409/14015_1 /TAXON_ID=97485 /ORGANISM="Prymnesium parvum, Strain Texoma1" /LENGTH=216 /DNA_ID=CAMNT_0026741411 /DNA_START=88 /DNA_END=738 /DNA_ORIENTATION=-